MGTHRFRLETERLLIRDHLRGDFEFYYALFADPEVTEFTYNGLRSDRKAQRREFKDVLAQPTLAVRDKYYLCVEDRRSGDFIGDCGFDIQRKEAFGGIAEAGYFLSRERWGLGYGTEILSALIKYCFRDVGLHKVIATCDARNVRSARVIEKCGMEREGILRRQRYVRTSGSPAGEWVDEYLYGILNEG